LSLIFRISASVKSFFVICLLLQCAANQQILPALWDYPQLRLQSLAIRRCGAESLWKTGSQIPGRAWRGFARAANRCAARQIASAAAGRRMAIRRRCDARTTILQEPGLLLPYSSGHVL
jgi:hypothetical protein